MFYKAGFICLIFCLVLAGCAGGAIKKPTIGGYYGGDSPPKKQPKDFDQIPDAVPRHEPLSKTGNKPYVALGKSFRPLKSSKGYIKTGMASWYGEKFQGKRTSSGETYNMWEMTAAHPVLPLPTYVEVTNLDTGKKIVVKVNDRGPFLHNRIIDLSYVAAHKLGIAKRGTGRVKVRALDPDTYVAAKSKPGAVVISKSANGIQTQSPGQYFVQVGAYSDVNNALSMRNKLRENGHSVYPQSEQQNFAQGIPYKVQVGPFQKIENALEIKRNLERFLGQNLLLIMK